MKKKILKRSAFVVIFTILLSAVTALAAENIVLAADETEMIVSVIVPQIDEPCKGIHFDVILDKDSGLEFKGFVSGSAPGGVKMAHGQARETDGTITYLAGVVGEDKVMFSGGPTVICQLAFQYTGTESAALTIKNFVLSRHQATERPNLIYVYNVSRDDVTQMAAAPTASPEAGSYDTAQTVTLSSVTAGAAIYYTTNGDTPTEESTLYTEAIAVNQTTAIRAIAVKDGLENSNVSSFAYTITTSGGDDGPGGGGNEELPPDDDIPLPGLLPFEDVETTDWFYGDVYYAWLEDLVRGTTDTTFSPNMPITRGMVVTLLYRMEEEPVVAALANPFSDVTAEQYYTDAVIWAADNEIVLGYGDGTFRPGNAVTRQDMAELLRRYTVFAEMDVPEVRAYTAFDDESLFAGYTKEAIEIFYKAGIIDGKPSRKFDPQGTATRAEFTKMLHGLLQPVEA